MTEYADWDRLATELNFLNIVREEAKRTIHCEPHRVNQIRAAVDQAGAASVITVCGNPACPPGQILVLDEGAMAAAHEEFLQGLASKPWNGGRS